MTAAWLDSFSESLRSTPGLPFTSRAGSLRKERSRPTRRWRNSSAACKENRFCYKTKYNQKHHFRFKIIPKTKRNWKWLVKTLVIFQKYFNKPFDTYIFLPKVIFLQKIFLNYYFRTFRVIDVLVKPIVKYELYLQFKTFETNFYQISCFWRNGLSSVTTEAQMES